MMPLRYFWALPPLLFLVACTKTGVDTNLTRQDFDNICSAQRQFLEARQLKGVNEAELLVERNSRMVDGLQSEAAMGIAAALLEPGSPARREKIESAAREGGLKDWSCPALGEGP